MDNTIKYGLIFAAGAAIGSAATYFSLKSHYEKMANEEIDSIRNYYHENYISKKAVKVGEKKEESVDDEKSYVGYIPDNYRGYFTKDEERRLSEAEHPEDDTPAETDEERLENIGNDITEEIGSGQEPMIITDEEFGEEPELDKVTLYFYVGDDVVATEDDEEILDAEKYIGDAIEDSNFVDSEVQTLYVRNLNMGADYEIIKLDSSFADTRGD